MSSKPDVPQEQSIQVIGASVSPYEQTWLTSILIEEHYQPLFAHYPSAEEFSIRTIATLFFAEILTLRCNGDLDLLNHAAHWLSWGMSESQVQSLVVRGGNQ